MLKNIGQIRNEKYNSIRLQKDDKGKRRKRPAAGPATTVFVLPLSSVSNFTDLRIYIFIYMSTQIYIYIYINLYLYIYIYIYIYVYIYFLAQVELKHDLIRQD